MTYHFLTSPVSSHYMTGARPKQDLKL